MVNIKSQIIVNRNILSGSLTLTDNNPIKLSNISTPCNNVTIKADLDNINYANYILVGNSINQDIKLLAGESINLNIDNLNKVYVKKVGNENLLLSYIGGAL